MLKSLFKHPKAIYNYQDYSSKDVGKIDSIKSESLGSIRKHRYNFLLRYLREILWCIMPWGRSRFYKWVDTCQPKAIFYMVGESLFEDKLVLKIAKRNKIPIILYNCEAYRIVDCNKRKGLEKKFYKKIEKTYKKVLDNASLVIYNCDILKQEYNLKYNTDKPSEIVYNSDKCITSEYLKPKDNLVISYFGNLGVGRVDSLLEIADVISNFPKLVVDVYGVATGHDLERLKQHAAIRYHGFVNQEELLKVRLNSDILIHVESFDSEIMPKLKYAFSTKIAQYLCSGRCVFSYAPENTASTIYLKKEDCACVATSKDEMKELLINLIFSADLRVEYSKKALRVAKVNHDMKVMSQRVKKILESVYEI